MEIYSRKINTVLPSEIYESNSSAPVIINRNFGSETVSSKYFIVQQISAITVILFSGVFLVRKGVSLVCLLSLSKLYSLMSSSIIIRLINDDNKRIQNGFKKLPRHRYKYIDLTHSYVYVHHWFCRDVSKTCIDGCKIYYLDYVRHKLRLI